MNECIYCGTAFDVWPDEESVCESCTTEEDIWDEICIEEELDEGEDPIENQCLSIG